MKPEPKFPINYPQCSTPDCMQQAMLEPDKTYDSIPIRHKVTPRRKEQGLPGEIILVVWPIRPAKDGLCYYCHGKKAGQFGKTFEVDMWGKLLHRALKGRRI